MDEEFDDLELARNVESYQRRTETGKVVTVRGYVRTDNSAVADRARQSPGRPSIAASSGRFPSDRAIPIFPDAGKTFTSQTEDEEVVEYEGLEDTGVVDQGLLDAEIPVALEILPKLPQNPAMKKLIGILKSLSTVSLSHDPAFDPDIIELARRGVVKVTGYSYISKKTGKVVRVNPYTQIRNLISGLGGPTMAARKGVTADLLDSALPGYQVKDKVFKAKSASSKVGRTAAQRQAGKRSTSDVLREINSIQVDRSFDIQDPKPGDDWMRKAMSATHPLEAVRNAREGSQVARGNDSWVRGMDGKWYKTPRMNGKGLTDRELTRRLASKAGQVDLVQGDPIERKDFTSSKVDYDDLNPNSKNYAQSVRYAKALEPTFRNLPVGIADSINGNLEVRRQSGDRDKDYRSMTNTTATKANNHYPKMVVNPNPDFEDDLIKTLPKQQKAGYNVPSILHPVETAMARESATFVEKLLENRAPADINERMYDRFNAIYDKHIKDGGDYSGLSGKEGWVARLTGERSDELKKTIRDELSMSALSSPEDFLAESWTEYVGHPSPRPLAREIGAAYQMGMEEFSNYLYKNNWVDASEIPEKTWQKTTKKSMSRKIADSIGGETDNTREVVHAPRDMRSVLKDSSKYIDIRDGNGDPIFDAEVRHDGETANISALSYPLTDPTTMPMGIPNNVSIVTLQKGARYYETPLESMRKGDDNQKKYSDFIDRQKAVLAIEAIEEHMFSQGITRFEADARPGEDSLVYAQAGYVFDPNDTDVQEITNILGDIRAYMDSIQPDAKEGYWVLPKNVQRSIKTKLNKWDRTMTADPLTWPTPQEIAQLGKMTDDDKSVGEVALDNRAWSGVKTLTGKDYPTSRTEDAPYSPPNHTISDSLREFAPRASTLGNVARAVSNPNPMPKDPTPDPDAAPRTPKKELSEEDKHQAKLLKNAITELGADVFKKHADRYPDGKVIVNGSVDKHSITMKSSNGKQIFRLDVTKRENGDIEWSGPSIDKTDLASAFLALDMIDALESSYQQSNVPFVWKNPRREDPVANYVLASSGYTWAKPPTRDALDVIFKNEINVQVDRAREVFEIENSLVTRTGSTEDLFKAQRRVDKQVDELRESLTKQANAYLERFDTDPDGPTPFEIAQFGKKEAYRVENIRRSKTPSVRNFSEVQPPAPLKENATPKEVEAYHRAVEKYEAALERQRRQEGTLLQQMTSLDGDALHDSFAEFVGKQALTGGTYGWYKTMGGYWKWATDTYNPSSRKASVSLLFMLMRLLPASIGRGALMTTVNMMVKRIKSPRPDDWPSPQEIEAVIADLEKHIPAEKVQELKEDL